MTCIVCLKEFKRKARKKDACRCCSRECGFKWIRDTKREKLLEKISGSTCFAEWRKCRYCESLFLSRRESKWFCSISCSSKTATISGLKCIDCGEKREVYSQRCTECRVKHASRPELLEAKKRWKKLGKARRRAKGKAVISAPVSLADVISKYGKRCHICGKVVDVSTTNEPHSATMDHIVPLSLGGWHDLSNLRPAHHLCNSLKGSSFTGQLMLTC